jgi:peptidoglycan/xylan/chitin deacetylase (PgdA/CDA1 family)
MPGTIIFGIDVESASESSLAFVEHGGSLFSELNIPSSWFLTGTTLEKYPDVFKALDGGLADLQAHTYNHILLKTVLMQLPPGVEVHNSTDWFMYRGSSLEEIDADLTHCQQVFQDAMGRRATALTAPWCYYRGLGDRPDILEIVYKHGFRALRTFGRDEHDCQPVPVEWRPFFYKVQGFPDVLECFIHDYQDDFYWQAFVRPGENDTYQDHLRKVADRVAREDLTWSFCTHDHGWADPDRRAAKLAWIRPTLEYALELGIRFVTISQYYKERMASA